MSPRIDNLIDNLLSEQPVRSGSGWRDGKQLWRHYLMHHRRSVIAAVALTIIWSALPFAFPLTWRFLVDDVLRFGGGDVPEDQLGRHGWLCLAFFGMNAGVWVGLLATTWLRQWLIAHIGQGLVYRLRANLHRKLQALHVGFFEKTPVGIIISRVLDDVNVIHKWITTFGFRAVASGIQITVGMALLLYLRWELALIVVASLPIYAWSFAKLRPVIRRANRALRRLNAKMYARSTERVGGVEVVKAFAREQTETRVFAKLGHDSVRVAMRLSRYNQWLALLAGTITAVTTGVILYAAGAMVRDGAMTIGDLVAFTGALQRIFMPIRDLTNLATAIQQALVVLRRVFAVLEEPEEVVPGKINLDGMSGRIVFDGVNFTYPQATTPALADISFRIKPGESVALMGPSGSGKSTVCQLLLRFYDPTEGNVRVGGVDLTEADPGSIRGHIRMVQQEPTIFSGTIADNIRYGRLDANGKQLRHSAKQAELHEFVEALPDGYQTTVGENGVTLSGGQRQRLALATALLTDPEVLLLDDTTSALDAATEARIRETLNHVLKDRTSLIVTQRIATARNCDRILVFENGHIVQEGGHEDLKAQPGFYAQVCHEQEES